jgi:hypothetical protein
MTLLLQDIIHKIEAGVGPRAVRVTLAVLAVLALVLGYNWRSFRNFSTQEAMDSAQLARNISEGRGYTTQFIRPFSMFLIKRANQGRLGSLDEARRQDLCEVKGRHPDIANPPVYPVLVAGLMKTLPFRHDALKQRPFWWSGGVFARYQPDFFIAIFNQCLLLTLAVATFLVARRLFDVQVAWLSAILLACTELLWKFSVSGLSTMLLLVIFMGLVWTLMRIEQGAREPAPRARRLLLFAVVAGLLLGVGTLTRYSFGMLVVPVLLFVVLAGGQRRTASALVIVGVFMAVIAPWVARNLAVCGMPFGTAGYAILDGSFYFPGNKLGRSLEPDFTSVSLTPLWWKFFINTRLIIMNELPRFGGTWVSAFFLAGLVMNFRSQALNRLRLFTLGTMALLIAVQALGRTSLSEDSPEINSENLLVLLLPLVVVYGAGFFLTLLEQVHFPARVMRHLAVGLFGVVMSLPLIYSFLPPRSQPLSYPPYYPPYIQETSGWMSEDELVMSDIPWAVAWYGDQQCIWLTLDADAEFFAVNDFIKPVRALYLTPVTLDSKFLSQWIRAGGDRSWGGIVVGTMLQQSLPLGFPLRKSVQKYLPEQLFLSDWERWLKPDALDLNVPVPGEPKPKKEAPAAEPQPKKSP